MGQILLPVFLFLVILSAFAGNPTPTHKGRNIPGICDTIIINDTIYIRDTVRLVKTVRDTVFVYDTLNLQRRTYLNNNLEEYLAIQKIDNKNIPQLLPYSLTLSFSPNFSNIIFSGTPIYSKYTIQNNNAISGMPGYSIGVGASLQRKNLYFRSSIDYSQFNQNFSMTERQMLIDSVWDYKFFTGYETEYDTVWFINIDTLLATGDTLWSPYPIENTVTIVDSVLQWQADTTKEYTNFKSSNRYHFIDIPLITGYSFGRKHYQIQTEIGLISSFLLHSSGNIVSLKDVEKHVEIDKETRVGPFLLSYYLSAGLKYYLNYRSNIGIKMYYRGSVNSMFSDYPLVLRNHIFGLQIMYSFKLSAR